MKKAWPPEATDEECSLRLFKDALMKRGMAAFRALLFPESEEELRRRTAEVEHAYARVREHAPAELKGGTAPAYAEVLIALRRKDEESEKALPPRRVLVHMLANLDYYFFELSSGYERVHDMPHLTDEERAAEHGLRHDLLLKLYDELEPAFDLSLNWPPNGYKVDEDGELVGHLTRISPFAGYHHRLLYTLPVQALVLLTAVFEMIDPLLTGSLEQGKRKVYRAGEGLEDQ